MRKVLYAPGKLIRKHGEEFVKNSEFEGHYYEIWRCERFHEEPIFGFTHEIRQRTTTLMSGKFATAEEAEQAAIEELAKIS
jgi:hypothetical protein